MSKNRAIRRAAERLARSAAMQDQPQSQPLTMAASAAAAATGAGTYIAEESDDAPNTPRPVSDAKLAANRLNAQKSTGAVTPEGRAKSCLNAVKTALTGQTVLLPSDDVEVYQAHVQQCIAHYAPTTPQERSLVQRIADADWRIDRIAPLEASILAIGRVKLAGLFPEESDPAVRETLIKGEIYLVYRRDLHNLALQERRLRNHKNADIAELQALREERTKARMEKNAMQERMRKGIRLWLHVQRNNVPFDTSGVGFEFSATEIEHCYQAIEAAKSRNEPEPCVVDLLAAFRNRAEEASAA